MRLELLDQGPLVAEGKTKRILEVIGEGAEGLVLVENKDDVTAFDDPRFTKQFGSKGRCATTTTCRVFELLADCGIPLAYVGQYSDNAFLARRCRMAPLEVVARRYVVPASSYLKRHPELSSDSLPYRFPQLKVEFFLKTTKGEVRNAAGDVCLSGLSVEDPLILNPYNQPWTLVHPKMSDWSEGGIIATDFYGRFEINFGLDVPVMAKLVRQVFAALEGAWNSLGYRLIDLKIEFGYDDAGRLVVADVIDNDSWRLTLPDWQDISKQAFRDGASLSEVEAKYLRVAQLVQGFHLPKQAIVFWRASEKDVLPPAPLSGFDLVTVTASGHKQTNQSLQRLQRLMEGYPDGGVIICFVGRSNGLAPVLAAHTTWPVIAVPTTAKEFPEDVWSSLRMPSNVPVATVLDPGNAVSLAKNILAARNPLLYMNEQLAMEERD